MELVDLSTETKMARFPGRRLTTASGLDSMASKISSTVGPSSGKKNLASEYFGVFFFGFFEFLRKTHTCVAANEKLSVKGHGSGFFISYGQFSRASTSSGVVINDFTVNSNYGITTSPMLANIWLVSFFFVTNTYHYIRLQTNPKGIQLQKINSEKSTGVFFFFGSKKTYVH